MVMMKFVCKTTEPYGVPTTVSMSPIMIDGTGMCGGCRLTRRRRDEVRLRRRPRLRRPPGRLGSELIKRNQMYRDFELRKHEEVCNLFKQEVK